MLVPKMTIFALGDCASASVASMPRQRRYESEMPWLTVRLKRGDAVGLDLLALGFLRLALDAEFIFLDLVVLLGLAVDGGDDGRRQLDAEHQRIEELDRALQEVVVVLGIGLLHGLGLHQLVETGAERLLAAVVNLRWIASREV